VGLAVQQAEATTSSCAASSIKIAMFALLLLILSTLSNSTATVSLSATADDGGEGSCINFVRIEDGICAEACLASFVGPCPRAIVVVAGFLEPGQCDARGFAVAKGKKTIIAGPCGALDFGLYAQQPSSVDGCVNYHEIDDGQCMDLCFPENSPAGSRLFLASVGSWEVGLCEDDGYTLANGAFTKWNLRFNLYLPGIGRLQPGAITRGPVNAPFCDSAWICIVAFAALGCYRSRKDLRLRRLLRSTSRLGPGMVQGVSAVLVAEPPSRAKVCSHAFGALV